MLRNRYLRRAVRFSSDPAPATGRQSAGILSDARSLVALFAVWLLIAPHPIVRAQAAAPQGLNIEIVEGDGAINNLRLRTAREAIVEVQDENHKPVSGALVLFSARGGNPFSRTVLRATTDATGRVRANPLQLHANAGKFDIHVKASYQGRTATQTIHQTNSTQSGPDASTDASAAGVSAGVSAVVVRAVPAGAGFTAAGILIVAGLAIGGLVGGLFGAGVIGGGGKTAQISVGAPHF